MLKLDLEANWRKAYQRLEDLTELEDDWDGDGAPMIEANAIVKARAVLDSVPHFFPCPLISPSLDGGVGISWRWSKEQGIFLLVSPDGTAVRVIHHDGDVVGEAN